MAAAESPWVAQVLREDDCTTAVTFSSGVERLTAIWVPPTSLITNIVVPLHGAGSDLTDWWFTIRDLSYNLLAVTAHQSTASTSADTDQSLAIASAAVIAPGAPSGVAVVNYTNAGPFSDIQGGWRYIGVMFAESGGANPTGVGLPAVIGPRLAALPYIGGNSSTTGSTTAPAIPSATGAPSVGLARFQARLN